MIEDSKNGLQAVVFQAGGTVFGADIRDVREIMMLNGITAIPGSSGHMEGVINVRGEVVPLLSLRSMTGAPQCQHDKETRVLILDCHPPLGLIVDMVGEVKSIPGTALEPMPSIANATGIESLYKGIAKLPDRMIILMDLKKISASADEASSDGEVAVCMPSEPAPAADTSAAVVAIEQASSALAPANNAYVTADSPLKLTDFQMDALREMGNIGTSHSATSLSVLVGREINITVPAISLEHIDNIPSIISNDKVVGLLLDIKDGDRTIGYLYTIFSERSAANIVDTLLGQPQGTTTVIGEMEQSAIMEVGNILASSFCDAIAEFLGIVLLPSPPNFVNDMVSAIIQSSLIEISMIADDAILFRTDLTDEQQIFDGYVILFPNPEMLDRMLSILDAKVNP
ncbi:MAG TPA: chemotaxis protein CheW [Methanocella sp.]